MGLVDKLYVKKSENSEIRVGLATCGLSAGAKPIYDLLMEDPRVKEQGYLVKQVGCLGACRVEPMIEVLDELGATTYINLTKKKVEEIISQHIAKGIICYDHVIGGEDKDA